MNADAYKYIRHNTSQETRWATEDELRRSSCHIDLSAKDYPIAGLPLMSDGKEAYVDGSDTHSLIFGATGSKKTRLFCMPMINIMAKAGESFVVTDPKGELYAQTAGLVREKGYRTAVLNFRDIGQGDSWNPLTLPYELWLAGKRDEAGHLLSDLVSAISASLRKTTTDAFWGEAAQALAIAGLYVLMESGKQSEINMKSFAALSSQSNMENIKTLVAMMREDSIPAINYASTACLDADSTVAGIVGELYGMLRIFTANEKLSEMLSDTSFDIRRIGRERTAVYIIVPDEKTTYHFLVTMFLKQVYEIMIEEAQQEKNRALPIRVNFVLDEFCNIPAIPDMPSMVSAARSRNMRYFLVVQSMHQLRGKYGDDAETIKGNCDNWVFLTSKELSLLNEISELCGNVTLPDGRQRRLISVSELQRFDKERGEALIMHARQYPIISEMPDILQYGMFGLYEPPALARRQQGPVACFSTATLLQDIKELRAVAPFASREHMIKQAKDIYDEELAIAEREALESTEKDEEITIEGDAEDILRILVSIEGSEDAELSEKEAAMTAEERVRYILSGQKEKDERKETPKLAEERAWKRIASLMGEDFAEKFFETPNDKLPKKTVKKSEMSFDDWFNS